MPITDSDPVVDPAADRSPLILADPGEHLSPDRHEQVRRVVAGNGYALLRGFRPTVDHYETFSSGFGQCADTREVHYPTTGEGLGFHAEDSYNPYRPDAIWFFCANQGSDGGIPTGVVDGTALLAALPPRWQSFSRRHRLRFDRQWEPAVWRQAPGDRQQISRALDTVAGIEHQFLADGSLHVAYETPLVVRTPGGLDSFANTLLQAVTDPDFYGLSLTDGSTIIDEVPAELISVATALAAELELDVGWESGDIAVIDNRRMMHRRRDYSQVDRDLRARHGEDFLGSTLPPAADPMGRWVKELVQGDISLPTRVGRPRPDQGHQPLESLLSSATTGGR